MMRFFVLTLFPDLIETAVHTSITGRAMEKGVFSVDTVNIRDFSIHGTMRVDDYPYGGGAGMVMEAEPIFQAVQSVEKKLQHRPRVVYLTPQAKVLTQEKVQELAKEEELILLCGHYEGIDERVIEEVVTDTISIGDYVLTGGELPAAILIDAISRFLPGTLHNEESAIEESLQDHLLEYPQYTRPEVWRDRQVPKVLLTGDHAKIEEWRFAQSLQRTEKWRPDLLKQRRQIHTIWFGDEKTGEMAEAMHRQMNRRAILHGFNQRKEYETPLALQERDILLLFLPEQPEGVKPLSKRFSQLSGEQTPMLLMAFYPDVLAQGQQYFVSHGFSVMDTFVLTEQVENNLAVLEQTMQRHLLF